jgi:serine acetyltransferase
VVGANAVVIADVADGEVVVGIPARPIGKAH